MLAKAKSWAVVGLDGFIVEVEVDISPGLPAFNIVGLPDVAVQEARERVRAAIHNSGCEFAMRRSTENLDWSTAEGRLVARTLASSWRTCQACGRRPTLESGGPSEAHSGGFVNYCINHFRAMWPVNRWLLAIFALADEMQLRRLGGL